MGSCGRRVFVGSCVGFLFGEKDGRFTILICVRECYDEVTGSSGLRWRWRRKSRCCKRIKAGGLEVACLFVGGGYVVSFTQECWGCGDGSTKLADGC